MIIIINYDIMFESLDCEANWLVAMMFFFDEGNLKSIAGLSSDRQFVLCFHVLAQWRLPKVTKG